MARQPRVSRGRPKSYDPDVALAAARDLFWERGYGAASLDDLSDATRMHRPSMYREFGDKEDLFVLVLRRYTADTERAMRHLLESDMPLRECLLRLYRGAYTVYLQGPRARGCLMVSSAMSEALNSPRVRASIASNIRMLDGLFAERMQRAIVRHELPPDCDAELQGQLATGMLHTLALRARSGASKKDLEALAVRAAAVCSTTAAG